MSHLRKELAEKFPDLKFLIGCGADLWCGRRPTLEEGNQCIQMEWGVITSTSSPDGWEVEKLPVKGDAVGCSGCLAVRKD